MALCPVLSHCFIGQLYTIGLLLGDILGVVRKRLLMCTCEFETTVYLFLPLFDRPKINIVFSNTLKVRSCIANQIYNSKTYLEKKKENTGFVWNAASASDFRQNKEVDLCFKFLISYVQKAFPKFLYLRIYV